MKISSVESTFKVSPPLRFSICKVIRFFFQFSLPSLPPPLFLIPFPLIVVTLIKFLAQNLCSNCFPPAFKISGFSFSDLGVDSFPDLCSFALNFINDYFHWIFWPTSGGVEFNLKRKNNCFFSKKIK